MSTIPRVFMTLACAIAVLSVLSTGHAESTAVEQQDIWKGKQRQEIVALLGQPHSTKKLREGGEIIVYKLVRLGEDALPQPGMLLITLPDYGLLGRLPDRESQDESADIEPIAVDKHGRPVSGGMTRTERREISWSKKEGKTTDPTLAAEPQSRGKVKLSFELDGAGAVRSWSVSPPASKPSPGAGP